MSSNQRTIRRGAPTRRAQHPAPVTSDSESVAARLEAAYGSADEMLAATLRTWAAQTPPSTEWTTAAPLTQLGVLAYKPHPTRIRTTANSIAIYVASRLAVNPDNSVRAVWGPDSVEPALATNYAGSARSTAVWAGRLRRISRTLVPETYNHLTPTAFKGTEPRQPYTRHELAAMLTYLDATSGVTIERIRTLTALSLGAGLTRADIKQLRGTDITTHEDCVRVNVRTSNRQRTVVIHHTLEEFIARLGADAGDDLVYTGELDLARLCDGRRRYPDSIARPVLTRMRNTWMVNLGTNTRIGVYTAMSGVVGEHQLRLITANTVLTDDDVANARGSAAPRGAIGQLRFNDMDTRPSLAPAAHLGLAGTE